MKKLLLIFLFLPSLAWAQVPTADQRYQALISRLIGENIDLSVRMDAMTIELQQLRKELSDAKQVPSASTPDGGSGAQPEVRQEGRRPARRREGVQ